MARKSGLEIAGNLAHLAKALHDIIKAFLQGGWAKAALQALKHYWPQILTVALVLIFLPIIIFCCIPMMLFGYKSSTDAEISSMTVQASMVSGYYDNYESYIDEWVENIKSTVTNNISPDTETNGTAHNTDETEAAEYEVVFTGTKIQKNWFIALHTVIVGNDLNAVTEAAVKEFSRKCVSYTIRPAVQNTENETDDSETANNEENTSKMVLDICYRTPAEIMQECNFTDSDGNWAQLIHKTLETGNDYTLSF